LKQHSPTSLTEKEKSIIKALLKENWRNQDIQMLVNTGRSAPINAGRISGVKANSAIVPASKEQVEAYKHKKQLFDHVTGLCPIDDERLVRAREAMILAVELFNTPRIAFKAGVFSMLANVAWTYLLHEYYERRKVKIIDKAGISLFLSKMIERQDCPLSKASKQNIVALKEIRDVVEHLTIGPFDLKWLPLFQSNCLNFEKALTSLFGQRLSLGKELGFALQFAKLGSDQIAILQGYDLPPHIASLDASLEARLEKGDADNLEYQFKVVYTLTNASKTKAHFEFVQPESAEGVEIQNVLIKYKPADDIYPLKPTEVAELVANGCGRKFTVDKHQRAWKLYKVRPNSAADDPASTDKRYCIYHPPYKSYTYSQDWVNFLITEMKDDKKWGAISSLTSK
jgi:hypothetical protein